ncbi:MAG TPA: TadE family type IV pilus minor pilin [Nocardioidaceae bacterium]|nr:TadE family type IV pilus minor pilin [Nocardioidaceae bacterium]
MVTAEAAMVIPVLLLVTVALAWLVTLGIAQVRCLDAAREAARLAARGEPPGAVTAAAQRAGLPGSRVFVDRTGETVTVQVEAVVVPDVPLLDQLPGVTLRADATSADEETDDIR